MNHESFYRDLTSRNRTLIPAELQNRLRRQRFVIAGVGSTGGACVMPLLRTGAERLVLVDPGRYEVSNLNRQEARLSDVGRNKAQVQAERALEVNPFVQVEAHDCGIDPENAGHLLHEGDVVIDAIDVTETSGVAAKVALHHAGCALHLRVITAYDIASTQYVELYDYTRTRRPLRGRIGAGERDPLRLLRALVPLTALPHEIFAVLKDQRVHPEKGWPQLAMTSGALGPLVVAYVLRLLCDRPVRRSVRVDALDTVRPLAWRMLHRRRRDLSLALALWQDYGG